MSRPFFWVIATASLALRSAAAAPLETPRFIFVSGPGAEEVTAGLAETAEQDRTAVGLDLGHEYDGRTTVNVVADRQSFDVWQPANQPIPEWVHAFADVPRNLIVLQAGADAGATRVAFQAALWTVAAGRLAHGHVPLWLLNGFGEVQLGEAWQRGAPSLPDLGREDQLFALSDLLQSFPARPSDANTAWAESAAYVQFLKERSGERAIKDTVRRTIDGGPFEDAFTHNFGANPRRMENMFRHSTMKWVVLMDFLTSPGTFWGCATLLLIVAAWSLRRRRRLRLQLLDMEEQAQATRTLLRTPALWADGPQARSAPTSPRALEGTVVPAETAAEGEAREAPKKPTLH